MHAARVFRPRNRFETRLDKEEQILKLPVIGSIENIRALQSIERIQTGARRRSGNNSLPRQHQRMRVMNFEERLEKQLLGVSKVMTQNRFGVNRRGKFVLQLPV